MPIARSFFKMHAWLCVFLLVSVLVAQAREGKNASSPSIERELEAIDLNKMCDIKALYEELNSFIPEKSDFETISKYNEKVKGELEKRGGSAYNIFCEMRSGALSYNAEKQAFEVDAFYRPTFKTEIVIGSFKGQNAFGVTMNVVEKYVDTWLFALNPLQFLIPMDARTAEEKSKSVRLGGYFEIKAPFISRKKSLTDASIENPEKILNDIRYVHVRAKRYFLYDSASGKVLWTADVNNCQKWSYSDYVEEHVGPCEKFDASKSMQSHSQPLRRKRQ